MHQKCTKNFLPRFLVQTANPPAPKNARFAPKIRLCTKSKIRFGAYNILIISILNT